MTKEKDAASRRALRITDQFRKDRGMVYDFRCEADRLTLSITPRANAEDEGEWRVDASVGRPPDASVISEWGVSPAEALGAVANSWAEQRLARRLPTFDWDAVAKALRDVRAI